MRIQDALAPSGKERHELANKTGTNSGQIWRGTPGAVGAQNDRGVGQED